MSYVSPNPKFSSVTFPDQDNGSVANPASGNYRMINRYGKWFARSSTGLELEVGILTKPLNAILDPNLATQWATSGAGMTVATSDTSTDLPLSPIIPTSIKLTPVSGTDYARYRFVMPESLRSQTLGIEWFQLPLAGYTSGDVKVEVHTNTLSDYTGTDATILLANNIAGVSSLPNTVGKYSSTFPANASIYYEIRFVRVSGTTAINLSGLYIGPDIAGSISDATSITKGIVYGSTVDTSRTMTNVTALGTVTTNLQHFEAFQTYTGQWKLKFYLSLLCNSIVSSNLFEFSISNVTFKNSSDFNQPLEINLSAAGPGQSQAIQAFTKPNTNEVRIYTTGSVVPNLYYWNLSGEVLLESQPSWA